MSRTSDMAHGCLVLTHRNNPDASRAADGPFLGRTVISPPDPDGARKLARPGTVWEGARGYPRKPLATNE